MNDDELSDGFVFFMNLRFHVKSSHCTHLLVRNTRNKMHAYCSVLSMQYFFLPTLICISFSSQILSRSSSIGSTSDNDSNISRSDTRTIRKDNRESIHSNSSSLKSARQIHSLMKNNTNAEDIRTATVTRMRRSEEELTHVSTPDINDDDDDT